MGIVVEGCRRLDRHQEDDKRSGEHPLLIMTPCTKKWINEINRHLLIDVWRIRNLLATNILDSGLKWH